MTSQGFREIVGGLIIILVIIGGVLYVPIVPVDVQEEYQVQEEYRELEPYTVDVEVKRSYKMIEENVTLQTVNLEVIDFSIDVTRSYSIDWSSTDAIIMVGILKESTWTLLKVALIGELGAVAVTTLLSGGTISAAIAPLIEPAIMATIGYIATSNDYYSLLTSSDSVQKNFESGLYKLIIVHVGNPCSVDVSVQHYYTEIVQETRFNNVTKTRTVTRYRTVTKKIPLWERMFGVFT